MAKRMFILSLLIAAVISLSLFALKGFGREEGTEKTKDLSVISKKIEEILDNQQDIIARLKDIREQQDIIRIRASRR